MKKKEHNARIQDLVGLINALYPPAYAEEWDNVGLQVGDPAAEVRRVLVCLDAGAPALDAALAAGAEAVIAHHPLVFQPLKNVVPAGETGRLLYRAIREGIAVLAVHTNLDRAPEGLNHWLAGILGLPQAAPLVSDVTDLVKLAVFVPTGYEEEVATALFAAGAGRVGNYDRCSFRTSGTGTFRPGPGTNPFLGREGETESAREVRLETVLPRAAVGRALEKLVKAHPYEEVACDLIPLENRREDMGLGRIGRLPEATTLGKFAERVKVALETPTVRVVGAPESRVAKVALCGGSGASVIGEAVRQGADVLVTGDIKYHEARKAESHGLGVIDAGHFYTERLMIPGLAAALRQEAQGRGLTIEFIEMKGEHDPFTTV